MTKELARWIALTINKQPDGMGLTWDRALALGEVLADELAIRYSRLWEINDEGRRLRSELWLAAYNDRPEEFDRIFADLMRGLR